MIKKLKIFPVFFLMIFFSINSSFAIEIKKLKIPKIGKSSSNGMSLDDT